MILLGLAAGVSIPPTITVSSSTNFNQNSGVLNAVVNTTGNRSVVSVEFQYSLSPSFSFGNSAWIAATVNTTISQGTTSTARSCSITGLTPSTDSVPVYYFVRARATNTSGFVTTSSIGGAFRTYILRTSTFTGSSTWSNPVPTSGTSGLAITSISDLFVVAGGGGQSLFFHSGAGGGGVQTSSSISVGSSVVVTIGAGGTIDGNGYVDTFFGPTPIPSAGSPSSIAGLSTLSAAGGAVSIYNGNPYGMIGGTSGNGYAGGASDYSNNEGGGGGGAGGVGQDAWTNGAYTPGNGGPGINGYGVGGGGGGGAGGIPYSDGPANSGQGCAGYENSSGIVLNGNGGSGYATFKYWGP